jgi:hypothetical protein
MENTVDLSYRLPGVPEKRLNAERWQDRLDDWVLLRKVPLRRERPEVRAGRGAEHTLRLKLTKHHSTRFGEVFGGKRVPRRIGDPKGGRYEIDLIVITPRRLHVIEVKNWSGVLSLDGDSWVHDRHCGERKVFPDLVDYNHVKSIALQRYLESCGIEVPVERVVQTVVFANPRLRMDSRIALNPNVVTADMLEDYLYCQRGPSLGAYAVSALIQLCAEADEASKLSDGLFDIMSPGTVSRVRAAVDELQTWDRLQLLGGREVIGDLLWLDVAENRLPAEVLESRSEINMAWQRGVFSFLPLFGVGPFGRLSGAGLSSRDLNVNDVVYFHEAGETRPAVIALRNVERIRIG